MPGEAAHLARPESKLANVSPPWTVQLRPSARLAAGAEAAAAARDGARPRLLHPPAGFPIGWWPDFVAATPAPDVSMKKNVELYAGFSKVRDEIEAEIYESSK